MGIPGRNALGLFISFPVCCFVLVFAHISILYPHPPPSEVAIQQVVEQMFTAFAKKDLDGVMACWAEKSPQFAEFKQFAQNDFATAADTQFVNVTFKQWKIETNKTTVCLRFDWKWNDTKTKKPFQQAMVWNILLVKDEDNWKWWQLSNAIYDLFFDAQYEGRVRMTMYRNGTVIKKDTLLLDIKSGMPPEEWIDALNYGSQAKAEQGFDAALALNGIAFEVAIMLGEKGKLAECCRYRGDIFTHQSHYGAALENYQHALVLFREVTNKSGEAQVLGQSGEVYRLIGKYGEALLQYEASLGIIKEISDKALEAQLLGRIGNVYQLTGKYREALAQYEASLKVFRELGALWKEEEAQTLNYIGGIYYSMGQYGKALAQYEAGLGIIKEISDNKALEAMTLINISNVYSLMGKKAEALAQYEASLKVFKELGMKAEEAQTLNNIGTIYKVTGKYAKALTQYETALQISPIGDIDATFRSYWGIGDVHQAQKQWDKAAEAYRKATALIEQVRSAAKEPSLQMGFFEQYTSPYSGLVASLLALNKREEAFQTAERAKARTLVELLEGGRVDIVTVMTEEEKRREGELNERITLANLELRPLQSQPNPNPDELDKVKTDLATARREYDAFRRQLYFAHPELQAQRGAFSPLTVAQATQWLQTQQVEPSEIPDRRPGAQDLLVLEYIVGGDQTWLFALNDMGELMAYPIKLTYKELKEHVNALGEAIRLKEEDRLGTLPQIEVALRQLDSLLAPAASLLAGARQVCIVPDDVMWEVPFAALKTPDDKYLVETHAVFYALSLTALKAEVKISKKQRQPPPNQLLALAPFAAPDGEHKDVTREIPLRGTFSALSKSENEVTAVSALFGAKPYLRETATETRAKTEAGQVRLLHFATHGLFDPLQGMYSGVLLAEEKGEDGYLEAREIVDLDLNADLAVLSACETARGQLSRGEGILGLSWAFFVAGCPSTIVSQWKVADESTAELMKAFYQNLKAGKGKAEGLRQAQLSLLHSQYPHPFYWAPFILVGDWQ
ncbi:CHAT domain-containing protein [Candidatus Poribacteria bacterium]|nr:CHAT domain-containing protein [Candidatus Poribacteria bacterium]